MARSLGRPALGQREQAQRSVTEAFEIFAALEEDWQLADLKERFGELAR